MDVSIPTVSPLCQRMVEDMRMRKFEPKTHPIIGSTTWRRLSNFFSLLGSLRVWLTSSVTAALDCTPR